MANWNTAQLRLIWFSCLELKGRRFQINLYDGWYYSKVYAALSSELIATELAF